MSRKPNLATMKRSQRALTEHLGPLAGGEIPRPHAGWVRATRDALGMTQTQLAARIGVTRSRITQIEQAEKNQRIQLDTLQRAAEAMNCTLVYALIPNGTYESVIQAQATSKTAPLAARVRHTMELENQRPDDAALERSNQAASADLVSSGRLWDV